MTIPGPELPALGSRLRRLAAAFLDWLVYTGAFLLLLLALAPLVRVRELSLVFYALGATALTALVVYQLALIAKTGQSLGKRWAQIEIVRANGRPPGFVFGVLLRSLVPALIPSLALLLFSDVTAALIGAVANPLSGQFYLSGLIGPLDALLIFGPGRRCLHDYIAGTTVVVSPPTSIPVRHLRLAAVALLLAPVVLGLSAAASFGLLYAKSCTGGHADCDGRWATLCEADLTSVESCGACGNVCSDVHAAASCVDGRCVLACEQGFADCDGDPKNGCQVDLSSDAAHCGSCGAGCTGAPCKRGSCGPKHIGHGFAIAADDAAVYAYRGDLVKYPLDGSPAVVLAPDDGQNDSSLVHQFGMAVDKAHVYWAPRDGRGHIPAVPIGGGAVTTFVRDEAGPMVIALAGESLVWWGGRSAVVLMTMRTSGGKPTVAVASRYLETPANLFGADASGLAWANDRGLWIQPTGSSVPTNLAAPDISGDNVALDAEYVYWIKPVDILMAVSRKGGAPIQLGTARTAMRLLLDERHVYWADVKNNTGAIRRVSKRGGATATLATSPSFFRGFAINSAHVFWIDEHHEIFMAPKEPR